MPQIHSVCVHSHCFYFSKFSWVIHHFMVWKENLMSILGTQIHVHWIEMKTNRKINFINLGKSTDLQSTFNILWLVALNH